MRDVEPGEMVIIDDQRPASRSPSGPPRAGSCVFEYVYFARPDSVLFGTQRVRARKALGRQLAREQPGGRGPGHPGARLRACPPRSASRRSPGMPYDIGLIRNHYVGRTFIEPQQAIRHFGVKLKLNRGPRGARRQAGGGGGRLDRARHHQPQDRQDDPRGRRARGAPAHLRRRRSGGPATTASTRRPRRELIGSSHKVDEIQRTSARTPSAISRSRACSRPPGRTRISFCHACFTGQYRVGFESEELAQLRLFDS